jgi:CelD/BcsL family acetyltransferase involved in cellulose biosynthesis
VIRLTPRVQEGPPDVWAALLASDPGASPAHRPAVWAALAASLPGMESRFIAAESDGRVIGGAPVMIERRAGFHWIHALPFLLPGTPLAPEQDRAAVDLAVAEGIAALQRERAALGGEWVCYRPDPSPGHGPALEIPCGETRVHPSALIDLDHGPEAALHRMERKTRQAIRHARALGMSFAEEPSALVEAYALYLRQSRGWRGHRVLPLELSRRLLAPAGGAADALGPAARLFTVRDGRGLLSATLALDHPRELLLWWSGTHPDARGGQAFTLLLGAIVEWAAAHGRARVNLGGSAGLVPVEAFKASLGARIVRVPVRWLDARHAPAAGRWVAALQNRIRRGRPLGELA